MALAIDIKDGHDQSNETWRITTADDYGSTLLAVNIAAKGILCTVYY